MSLHTLCILRWAEFLIIMLFLHYVSLYGSWTSHFELHVCFLRFLLTWEEEDIKRHPWTLWVSVRRTAQIIRGAGWFLFLNSCPPTCRQFRTLDHIAKGSIQQPSSSHFWWGFLILIYFFLLASVQACGRTMQAASRTAHWKEGMFSILHLFSCFCWTSSIKLFNVISYTEFWIGSILSSRNHDLPKLIMIRIC